MPREALRELQSRRLRELVGYVHRRVPFYRERLDDAGVSPGDVQGVEDLPRLPFTRKADLRDTYPFGLFAVPLAECVRVHASSGTTGKPIVVGYTHEDVDLFARVNARALAMAGAEPGMMLHNAYGYGLFTGGLGLHYGGERLGMTVVPVSGGMTERQLLLIQDFRPGPDQRARRATRSRSRRSSRERGGSPRTRCRLRFACVGAEPWTEAHARRDRRRPGHPLDQHLRADRDHRPGRLERVRRGTRRARTSTRTTSCRRSSTPRPASPCRRARRACSSSRR